jgi:DNA-directed RNA polymerase specialized sigma subunit
MEAIRQHMLEKAAAMGLLPCGHDSLAELREKMAAKARQLRLPFPPPVTSPIAEPPTPAGAPKPTKRQQDIDLWHQWHQGGRQPEHLEPLVSRFEPIITSKMRQWKPPMAQEEAFRTELRKQVVKALHTYDPSRGTAVSTHVVSRMPAAIRWGNQHANTAYIPEGKTRHIGPLLAAQDDLREELGRDPTHDELAHATGISLKHVQKTMGAMRKDVLSSSFESDPTPQESPRHMEIIEHLPAALPTDHHREVFYHMYGLEGRAKIDSPGAIARKIGKNPSQVSRMRTDILNIYKQNL